MSVTEIFVTQVIPGKELEYQAWNRKMQAQESQFPGFHGSYMQAPHRSGSSSWVTLLQFDTAENLERWLESGERKALLEEGATYMVALDNHRVSTPFSSWFGENKESGRDVPLWKQAMLILLVLFPIVMLEGLFLNQHLKGLNPSPAMFIGNMVSVALISWPCMPLMVRAFSWWLEGKRELLGCVLILLIYAIEISIFM